jgi:uncharacterized protein (UPF0333 family)
MRSKSESGIAHVALLILVLAVVSAVVLVGVHVMQNQNTGETSAAPVASSKTTAPGAIKSASDLNSAKAALNQTNVDGDLNPSSLDADLNDVL